MCLCGCGIYLLHHSKRQRGKTDIVKTLALLDVGHILMMLQNALYTDDSLEGVAPEQGNGWDRLARY